MLRVNSAEAGRGFFICKDNVTPSNWEAELTYRRHSPQDSDCISGFSAWGALREPDQKKAELELRQEKCFQKKLLLITSHGVGHTKYETEKLPTPRQTVSVLWGGARLELDHVNCWYLRITLMWGPRVVQ